MKSRPDGGPIPKSAGDASARVWITTVKLFLVLSGNNVDYFDSVSFF